MPEPAAPRVCFVISNIGDYHAARLLDLQARLQARGCSFEVLQLREHSTFYGHRQTRRATLLRDLSFSSIGASGGRGMARSLWRALVERDPSHILVLGYADRFSLTALLFARLKRRRIFFLSDSKADDQPRRRMTEAIKRLIVKRFDGALVAGDRHRRYFRSIGVSGPIETGYDVIDNDFFVGQAARLNRRPGLLAPILPERFVLCVSRLVPRKRLDRVIAIYEAAGLAARGIKLVIIGSGPGLEPLQQLVTARGLCAHVVHFADVKNSMMPVFYARAEAMILASDYDQWGLCANEAMAVGTPCIVSARCGCAGEIVHDGVTGTVFDGDDLARAADSLRAICEQPELRAAMSRASLDEIGRWNLDRFTTSAEKLVLAHAEGR